MNTARHLCWQVAVIVEPPGCSRARFVKALPNRIRRIVFFKRFQVEWREGISPSRSPRTGHEPLDSSGSSCEVISYDSYQKNCKVKFTQEGVLIAIRDIPQGWINGIDPENNRVGDELKVLFKEIDFKMNPFTW